MTYRQAVRIIGRDVRIGADYVGCIDAFGKPILLQCGPTDDDKRLKTALTKLVEANLKRAREFVLARDLYRCTNCGSFNALHADHKVARSKGRCDLPENLTSRCNDCHGTRHRVRGFHEEIA
jgi:hypothetical protein